MGFQESFKALSDPTRREILKLLKSGSLSAGEIVEHFNMTGATISHHLTILKNAGLIVDKKVGKYIYYELNLSVVEEVISWFTGLKE
ncbi:MAG: autorepressor SdpR family transcription factor [Aminipila sp.]